MAALHALACHQFQHMHCLLDQLLFTVEFLLSSPADIVSTALVESFAAATAKQCDN
jgi:hypothetical protein